MYRDFLANHIAILTPMLVFIGVLVLGLVYEVKKGALEWEK
ncbi:MAG TPA: NADH-quinone oxidoreductase subunit A [Opitutaceae bacterium]|nr:NADH-quinone oxidoreductase subunit A [Opitutaceae bacterium]